MEHPDGPTLLIQRGDILTMLAVERIPAHLRRWEVVGFGTGPQGTRVVILVNAEQVASALDLDRLRDLLDGHAMAYTPLSHRSTRRYDSHYAEAHATTFGLGAVIGHN